MSTPKVESNQTSTDSNVAGNSADKKKKMIIIAAGAILIFLGGGGAFTLLGGKKKPHKPPVEEEEIEEPVQKGPPTFVIMEPIVMNVADSRYLQVGITYQTTDAKAADNMKQYLPIIKSRILLLLSSKSLEELSTLNGKQLLADELLSLARDTVKYKFVNRGIIDVHFANFVIQ